MVRDEVRGKGDGSKPPEGRRSLVRWLRVPWVRSAAWWRVLADYGRPGVLVLLCLVYSAATLEVQHTTDEAAVRGMVSRLAQAFQSPACVVIVTQDRADDCHFADRLGQGLETAGFRVVAKIHGQPPTVRRALEDLLQSGVPIDCLATTPDYQLAVGNVKSRFPQLDGTMIEIPASHYWPTFLTLENLRNVANQIVVIGVIAVGMTLVIITGGIDLSVGSLVALSAVTAASLIVGFGGPEASAAAMVAASFGAILLCGAVGAFSGTMITRFAVPPVIATLAVMLVAQGMASLLTRGESVCQLPDSFIWLGRGADLPAIPNAVVLMLLVYAAAHLVLTRSTAGRYLYAVGGNRQAARLSGIQTARVLLGVYIVSGMMAGLGGVIEASQLKAGGPKFGQMYELYVIAAVIVGGTSLSGGEGRVLGTLLGASIIAVIHNGMNLTKVESHTQKIVLGLVILAAVLLDRLKKRGWSGFWKME